MSAYPLSDPNNPQPQQGGTDDQSSQPQIVTNMATAVPQPQTQQSQQPAPQAQPNQQPQPGDADTTVINAPPIHPAVQKAGVLRQVAEALAGGPRYTTAIDSQTGATTRTRVPLSSKDIGMAIAMEAITGALSGLSQRGPGAEGRAAEAGFQQVSEQRQAAQQAQQQDAQQQYQNETQALVRKANAMEVNSRTALNTAQSERYGVNSLKDAVAQNAQLLSNYEDVDAVQESHVSQDALSAGIKAGKYNATAQIAIPDGFTDINGRYEQTFSIVSNPAAKVPLSTEQAKAFADAGIPGFAAFKTGNIPNGVMVPGYMVANANQRLHAINLMKSDFASVSDALAKSTDKANQELAKSIPNIQSLLDDKNSGPVLNNSLSKFQKYVSHADMHGMDFYESLQQMAAPSKPDPRNPKQFIPNPDSGAAQAIAGAFGNGDPQKGWSILKAYHDQITPAQIQNEIQATAVLADPNSSSKAKIQARNFLAISQQTKAGTAGAEESAKLRAKGNITDSGDPVRFATEQSMNGVRPNYLASLPADHREMVRAIGEGRIDPASRLLYRKDGQEIMQEVTTAYPGYDFSRAPEYAATRKDFTSGKTSQAINALNTAMGHMLTMYQNATLGGSLPVVSGMERAAGNQTAINLANAKAALVDELGKAYKAGALTDQDVKIWKGRINVWSPAEIQGNAKSFAQLLDSKLNSYEQQWKNGSPPAAVAPIQILSPEARTAYQTITGRQPITGSQQPPVPGAIAGRDSSGRIVAWKLPNGTVQRVQ